VVYKWTDTDGVVHYSDQPVPGAEKIPTSGSANGIGGATRSAAGTAQTKIPAPGLDISVLTIESPAKDQVFFADDIVPIRLHLEPPLQPNQSITWHLNGELLNDQAPGATNFVLQSLPRGAYTIAATVTDSDSGQSQSTDSITFYVRQPSELAPQHKHP
jgi:hypothetical protein